MKGALIKELYAFKASRMIALIIVYAAVIILSAFFPTPWFSLVLFVLAFVAPLTYASNDDRHGWKTLVKALPVSTAKRVAARYIICCAELLLATVVTAVFNIVPGDKFLANAVNDVVMLFFIGALGMASVLLVSNIPQRGLRVPMGVITVITFSEWVFLLFGDTFYWFAGFKAILVFEKWIIPLVVLGGALLLVLSYLLTVHFSTQKFDRRPKVRKTIAATAACFGVIVCLSAAVLGVKGRLISEPMIDFDTFLNFNSFIDTDDKTVIHLFYNYRKTTNRQELSNIEMNDVLRKLAGKEILKEDSGETKSILEQAGLKAWTDEGLLSDIGDLACSSRYGTLYGYYISGGFSLYSDCQAKYIAVTDESEMDFDRSGFESGISELELLNLLEEKEMPVREFCEDTYYYGAEYREYIVYIVYENALTKELKIDYVTFIVEDGKLSNYSITHWNSEEYYYDDGYELPGSTMHIDKSREYMMKYAYAFCDKAIAGTDMELCHQALTQMGAQPFESNVFNSYILGEEYESYIDINFDELSAYPGEVGFIKASGETGTKRYEIMTENELAVICQRFRVGMSDEELVDLLAKEEFYPNTINESIDYTYNPEKIYKCYTFLLELGEYIPNSELENMYEKNCEIRVELYDGAVTNTLVYLDGLIEPKTNEQYIQLSEMKNKLNDNIRTDMSLAQVVHVFEEMNKKPIESVSTKSDSVLFETYKFDGYFVFSLGRQIPNGYDDEFFQLRMEICYIDKYAYNDLVGELELGDSGDDEFFEGVRSSRAYTALKDESIIAADIYIDET